MAGTKTTDDFEIRRTRPHDLDAVVEIVEHSFDTGDNQRLLGRRVLRAMFDLLLASRNSILLVVEARDHVIGFVWVEPEQLLLWKLALFSPLKSLKLACALVLDGKFSVLRRIRSQESYAGATGIYPRIVSLAVMAPFRKIGLAGRLVDEGLRELKTRGSVSCFVTTAPENSVAVNFYKRRGFIVTPDQGKEIILRKDISG